MPIPACTGLYRHVAEDINLVVSVQTHTMEVRRMSHFNGTVRWLFELSVAMVLWKSGCMIWLSGRNYEQSLNVIMAKHEQMGPMTQ